MKPVIFFLPIIFILIIVFVLTPPPFLITKDMKMSEKYEEKLNVSNQSLDYGFTQYTDKTKKLLDKNGNNLLGIRCSDGFIRSDQGVYFLEYSKTENKHTRLVKNEGFIEFMRDKEPKLPRGKKILTAKVCELENKTILLFYTAGSYDISLADSLTARRAIVYSENNTSYVEIIPQLSIVGTKTFEIGKSQDYLRCDQPFQVGKTGDLYLLCSEEGDGISSYLVNKINLKNGVVSLMGRCTNTFINKSKTICN